MEPSSRYSIQVFADHKDHGFVAVCPEFPGVSAFGDTREEALVEIGMALELAIETYVEEGWPLPQPKPLVIPDLPSRAFRVRLPRTVHAQLAERAVHEGVSQNQLVLTYVVAGLEGARWRGASSGSPSTIHDQVGVDPRQTAVASSASLTRSLGGSEDEFAEPENWEPLSDVNTGRPVERATVPLLRSVK